MKGEAAAAAVLSGEAWSQFCDSLKAAGQMVLVNEAAPPLIDKTEGLRDLTRMLRFGLESMLEFPDPDFPVFYHPSHETLKIMADNPDTLHFMAAVRGSNDYRIRGTRGTVNRIVFTTLGREPEDAGMFLEAGLDSSKLQVSADGSFEITVSKQPQPGNWLPLSDKSSQLLIRAIFLDRASEIPPTLSIERISAGPTAPAPLTPEQIVARLGAAAAVTSGMARHMTGFVEAIRAAGLENHIGADQKLWGAGDPSVSYFHGYWNLAPDEALIVESDVPDCFFWNFQINNVWMESLDYRYRKIHVNKRSAHYEQDGSLRIIIAHRDPGLPNWLDTAGHTCGTMVARWTDAARMPDMRARKVSCDQLRLL